MNTQSQLEIRNAAPERSSSADIVVGIAALGCLVAGIVGIYKALTMPTGLDVLLCLIASIAAFGMVLHICFRQK